MYSGRVVSGLSYRYIKSWRQITAPKKKSESYRKLTALKTERFDYLKDQQVIWIETSKTSKTSKLQLAKPSLSKGDFCCFFFLLCHVDLMKNSLASDVPFVICWKKTNKNRISNSCLKKKKEKKKDAQKYVKMTKTIFGKLRKALGNMLTLTWEKGLVFPESSRGTS